MPAGPSDMSTSSPHGAHNKSSRVLACVLCQHRKIKCDRNTPCSNCIKAGVSCTPSTPAPARKRRRPNQDLQERLARCEELLKQYAGGSAPSSATQQPLTPVTNAALPEDSASTPPAREDFMKWKPAGKMVKDDGGVRFMDSYLWASVYDELQAMRDIVDMEDPEDASVLGSEDLTPENNSDLLLGETSSSSLEDLQPDPMHVFRLWQLFLDRINPLTKVIHVPTLQQYVIDAATNMNQVPLNYQALLFAIYTMATVSLTEAECMSILGVPRAAALRRFTSGTKIALGRFNFLKNFDMAVLQALVLYLVSLQGRYDRHAAWILSGTIVRVAQKMGYHRDGELLHLTPFETEMRRRIWWQIMMQDAKNAMVSGLSHSLVPLNWDTKQPLNVNDADLFPGSTEPVVAREGPTEMAFCLLVYQIGKFMIATESTRGVPGFEAAIMGQDSESERNPREANQKSIETYRILVKELEQNLLEVETRYVDASAGKVHSACLIVRPMLIAKLREMLTPMHEQPEWGTEIFGPKDNMFKIIIMNNEHSTDAYEKMSQLGFLWFVKLHLQLDVLSVMAGQLCKRPSGLLAARAWNVIDKIYTYHEELFDVQQKQYNIHTLFVLRAWKAREHAYNQVGQAIDTPHFIYRLRDLMAQQESRSSEMSQADNTPPSATQPQQVTEIDQFPGGYLDVSALNWDVWGDMASNNTGSQIAAAAAYGSFNMGDMGGNMGGI